MKIQIVTLIFLILICSKSFSIESMPSMPMIKPTKTYLLQGNEELEESRGFGDKEPMVRMQNLMMVEGSGFEGMNMEMAVNNQSPPQASGYVHGEVSLPYKVELMNDPERFKVGANTVELSIKNSSDQKPSIKLKIKAQVFMTSMDMGIEEPKIKEVSPGKYSFKATFSMKGPWAIKLIFPEGEKVLNFDIR